MRSLRDNTFTNDKSGFASLNQMPITELVAELYRVPI